VNVRPIGPDDAETIAALAGADEAALHGRAGSRLGVADVRSWLTRVDLEHDSWLYEEDGRVVGGGWLALRDNALGTFSGLVAQGWKGRGIGAAILERAEERARAHGAVRVQGFGFEADAAAAELFAARGYAAVRRFYEMAIGLDEAPAVPALPPGLVLDAAGADEYRAFYEALDDAFREHWEWHPMPYEEWLEMRHGQHEDASGPLWFVVRDGDAIAAVVRNEPERNGGGFVGALGVRKPWRGHGLAKTLLLHTFAEFHRRGRRRVTLGVDAESATGATQLYEGVGMTAETCTVVYEKMQP
jgi:mycothiol synthase